MFCLNSHAHQRASHQHGHPTGPGQELGSGEPVTAAGGHQTGHRYHGVRGQREGACNWRHQTAE